MPIIYKIHDFTVQRVYDGVLEDGILYKLDGEVKTRLKEIPCWDHDWRQYEYDLCVISLGEGFGYADIQSGQIVHQPQWEDAMPFYDGRARVKENGKYGFINKAGKYVIEPEWDKSASSAHGGVIIVCKDKKWGFVNTVGEMVIPLEWDMVEGTAYRHEITTHWDISNIKAHQEVLPAAVYKNGKWGFIDVSGKVVVEPQFDSLEVECLPVGQMHTRWAEDKTSGVSRMTTFADKTIELTACPMYISLKRKSRWYRVQVGMDGEISILEGKHPKKIKDNQEGQQ